MQKHEQELKAIESSLLAVAIMDVPGTLLTALGLFGKYGQNPGSLLPLLADPVKVNFLLAIGLATMAMCAWKFFSLISKRARLLGTSP